MIKKLVKWLFESQQQISELEDQLEEIGISLSPLKESRKHILEYANGIDIILENIELPEDIDGEIMFEDFLYGVDFDEFWCKYGQVFEQ